MREAMTMQKFVCESICLALEKQNAVAAKNLSGSALHLKTAARMRVLEEEMDANEEELRDMETEYDGLIETLKALGIDQ